MASSTHLWNAIDSLRRGNGTPGLGLRGRDRFHDDSPTSIKLLVTHTPKNSTRRSQPSSTLKMRSCFVGMMLLIRSLCFSASSLGCVTRWLPWYRPKDSGCWFTVFAGILEKKASYPCKHRPNSWNPFCSVWSHIHSFVCKLLEWSSLCYAPISLNHEQSPFNFMWVRCKAFEEIYTNQNIFGVRIRSIGLLGHHSNWRINCQPVSAQNLVKSFGRGDFSWI